MPPGYYRVFGGHQKAAAWGRSLPAGAEGEADRLGRTASTGPDRENELRTGSGLTDDIVPIERGTFVMIRAWQRVTTSHPDRRGRFAR